MLFDVSIYFWCVCVCVCSYVYYRTQCISKYEAMQITHVSQWQFFVTFYHFSERTYVLQLFMHIAWITKEMERNWIEKLGFFLSLMLLIASAAWNEGRLPLAMVNPLNSNNAHNAKAIAWALLLLFAVAISAIIDSLFVACRRFQH